MKNETIETLIRTNTNSKTRCMNEINKNKRLIILSNIFSIITIFGIFVSVCFSATKIYQITRSGFLLVLFAFYELIIHLLVWIYLRERISKAQKDIQELNEMIDYYTNYCLYIQSYAHIYNDMYKDILDCDANYFYNKYNELFDDYFKKEIKTYEA